MRLEFSKLESLRLLCRQIQQDQVASLNYFAYDVGFGHVPSSKKISVSSSATCVLSLVATRQWSATKANTKKLLKDLLAKDTSADLPDDNPFTNAWILEAVTALERDYSDPLDPEDQARITHKEQKLRQDLIDGDGAVTILEYPLSPYLTQLVVRVLQARGKFEGLEAIVKRWSWDELARQLALVQARSKSRDPYAVVYLLMLFAAVTPTANISPAQSSIERAALDAVFESQLDDGTWPLSRPLFPYPGFGDAYCYEYEMLTQLLKRPELRELLLDYLPKVGASAEAVLKNIYRVKGQIPAWTSGHHPNQEEPESWATASVYHFVYEFDRILADAIRYEIFRYLEIPFPRSGPAGTDETQFARNFLDSDLEVDGERRSLKAFLWKEFVEPLKNAAPDIAAGQPLRKGIPRSAIFFGPPGTSKTELAREIAGFLGWPHLALDPSHFLRAGMDGIQAEANTIFRMLEETERMVVLFDEFDELVRERGTTTAEPFSRLLTTAMLPKLTRLHKRGTLVFIIATNNVTDFDLAIRRRGRFDHVLQVMPPKYEAKMGHKAWKFEENFRHLGVQQTPKIEQMLGELTFDETEAYASDLLKVSNAQSAVDLLTTKWKDCTLQTPISREDRETWSQRCEAESKLSH